MGRPRQIQLAGHRSKAEKNARIDAVRDDTGAFDDKGIQVPDWLSERAKNEFMRVAGLLSNVSDLDIAVLAVYADAVDNYEKLSRIIAKTGPALVKKRVTGKFEVFPNPAVSAQAEYVKRIMQCSVKLGRAVTDRLRLAAPVKEDGTDDFSEFEGMV